MRRATLLFAAAVVAAAAVVVAFVMWILAGIGGPRVTVWVDDLGELVAAWVAAAACAGAAWRQSGRGRLSWALFAASAFAWGAGEAVWSWYELHLGVQVPFPSAADAGFLCATPLAVAAVLAYPGMLLRRTSRLAGMLDGLIMASGLLTVSYLSVLRAVYQAGADTAVAQVLSLAYPISDVVICTMLLTLFVRLEPRHRLPVALLTLGLVANAVADSSFAYLTAAGTYGAGNALDAGWVAGYLLVALGALAAVLRPARGAAEQRLPTRWRVALPYLPASAAVILTAREVVIAGSLEPLLFWLLVALIVLVVARQFITLSDNLSLLRHLGMNEAEMRHRAFHDPLTGLANRALFARRLDIALDPVDVGGHNLVAVLVIDLDDFKEVNDRLGHDAGDRLLVGVAQRLRASVRPVDTAARLGGDEFAVLVDDLDDGAVAERVAARVVEALRGPVDVGPSPVPVQASVGLALARPGHLGRDELVRRADMAMYRAKSRGKGRYVVYDVSLDEQRPAHASTA